MRTPFRKATIKDVAARAGVSPTTVSHFVSGRAGTCAPETAERIRVAVEALAYAPSSQGRALRLRSTQTIGVCTGSLFEIPPEAVDPRSYVERFLRGVSAEAGKYDYALLFYPPSVREGKDHLPFLDGRVDGIVFHAYHGDSRPDTVAAAGVPVVLAGCSLDDSSLCGVAYASEADTVTLALTHLWECGHRRIAHVAGPVGPNPKEERRSDGQSDIAIQRYDHYVAWVRQRGVYDPALIAHEGSWASQQALKIVTAWRAMPDPPTAVFCANDALALGILAAAREIGWQVPGALAIVGVDNGPLGQVSTPTLTTVEIPVEAVGQEAVRMLLRLMEDPAAERRISVPVHNLIVRGST